MYFRAAFLICLLFSGVVEGRFQPFGINVRSVLIAGRIDRTDAGLYLNHYIFAEAGAPISPAPEFRLHNIIDPKNASNSTIVPIYNSSLGSQPEDQSNMTITVVSHPSLGLGNFISVPSVVYATANNSFVINGIVLPVAGRYNLRFVVNVKPLNRSLMFNYTIPVDRQPRQVLVTQLPQGYNGSALSPEPQGQLADFLNSPIRTSTPNVSLIVIAGPEGGVPQWEYFVSPNHNGEIRFPNVSLTQPGTYTWALRAKLSDGTFITSRFQTTTIERALPIAIVPVTLVRGITRALFFEVPRYRIVDQVGFSIDNRTNLTLTIGQNKPTATYEGQDTLAHFIGTSSVRQTGFDFIFPDLKIDLSGRFEIVAILYLSGEEILRYAYTVDIGDMPTFTTGQFQVNKQSNLTLFGFQPNIEPLFLMMTSDKQCRHPVSNVVQWYRSPNILTQQTFRIFFTPFLSGKNVYLCLQVPMQPDPVPLLVKYYPAFDEPFPLNYHLSIVGVDTCVALDTRQAFLYNMANWTTATAGRRYGCALMPPVQGTVSPCQCPLIYQCSTFTSPVFNPPGLNIGMCTCCAGPVLALACGLSCGFLAGLYWFIFMYL
jgi:hypothetical protein